MRTQLEEDVFSRDSSTTAESVISPSNIRPQLAHDIGETTLANIIELANLESE
jgi:hypothetical protein